MDIEGCSALVTGAASGLGAATARALARRGAQVIGIDLPPGVERAGQASATDGVRLVSADVTDEDEVLAAIAAIAAGSLRIVANCAGIAPARRIVSSRGVHDLATFRRTVEVNLVGTFNVLRLAAEAMTQNEPDEQGQRGVIVNTTSVAAFEGQIGQIAYAASKGGVAAMTIAAARDLAQHGIRVNAIAPGIVDTPLLAGLGEEVGASLAATIPFPRRLGRPEEFARLLISIAELDYLNGETIRLDAALRMGPR